jgi:hypothetical protein
MMNSIAELQVAFNKICAEANCTPVTRKSIIHSVIKEIEFDVSKLSVSWQKSSTPNKNGKDYWTVRITSELQIIYGGNGYTEVEPTTPPVLTKLSACRLNASPAMIKSVEDKVAVIKGKAIGRANTAEELAAIKSLQDSLLPDNNAMLVAF